MDRDYRSGRSRSPRYPTPSTNADKSALEEPQPPQQTTSSPSRSHKEDWQINDWRYPRQGASSLKRRSSQRSTSRPRSSHDSLSESVKEVDQKVKRSQEDQQQQQHSSHDSEPRKMPRLSHQHHHQHLSSGGGSRGGDVPSDWASKRTSPRMSDSEPTSASSRLQVSHSRTSSTEERAPVHATARRGSGQGTIQEMDEDQVSNYTWRHEREDQRRRETAESDGKSDDNASPSGSAARLPAFRSMAAPAGPLAAASYARHSSPSPRLPSFASLHPQSSSSSRHAMQGEDRGYNIARYPSPRPSGPQSITSAQSPSHSVSSQMTPGQAFIHPALAGLPGAGGVAGSKQQPSFVSKLYSMLEDDTIEDMISWGPSGTVFSVANPAEFSKVVLPNWFKHSNWQSFVRQLNMYGFHKVNHTYQGTPEEEIQVWEFKHPSFRRGEIQLLNDIKRKSSRHKRQESIGQGGMSSAADYDRSPGSTTPSPEITTSYMAPPPPGPSRGVVVAPSSSTSHPHRHHSTRSLGGAPSYSRYPEYATAVQHGTGPPRHHHSIGPSSSAYPAGLPMDEREGGGVIASEGATARMDDLSDRIDAIIRHASYLESQLRSVSDQLYQSQQNEVNLGRHVSHLEAQMRAIEDHLHHSSHQSSAAQLATSSSLAATQVPNAPIAPRETPRVVGPSPGPSSATKMPMRSPVASHPSYTSSYTRGPSSATTYSSADAYQTLPPPRSSSVRREDVRSPV